MKSVIVTGCLITCLLALMVPASAQANLTFSNLPSVKNPLPMPNGYGGLTWGNLFFVNPDEYSGAGSGYKLGVPNSDVVFVDGEFCRLGNVCYGTLSNATGFVLVSANAAAGFGPTAISVSAYRNGQFVGTQNYFLTTEMRTLNFPASWGAITYVSIQVDGAPGSFVLYDLKLYTLGG